MRKCSEARQASTGSDGSERVAASSERPVISRSASSSASFAPFKSVARIATDRVPNVVLVPADAVFQKDGSPVLYVLDGSMFEERRVQIARRGKEQSVVASGVEPGTRIASRRPEPDMIRRSQ